MEIQTKDIKIKQTEALIMQSEQAYMTMKNSVAKLNMALSQSLTEQ